MSKGSPSSSIATYIRRDECIRLSNNHQGQKDCHHHDGVSSSLAASIVGIGISNRQLSFVPSPNNNAANFNYLIGEIQEIKILDRNMNTVALHDKSSHPRHNHHHHAADPKIKEQKKREELMKKRSQLEQRHSQQIRELEQRQFDEKRAIENHANFTPEEMEYVLANVAEPLHAKQCRMMQERHRREQRHLMDLLFTSLLGEDMTDASLNYDPVVENAASQEYVTANNTAAVDTITQTAASTMPASNNSMSSSKRSTLSPVPESTASPSSSYNDDNSSTETSTQDSTMTTSYAESLISNNNNHIPLDLLQDYPKFANAIQQVMSNDPTIHFLNVDNNNDIPSSLWKILFDALANNTCVHRISLCYCNLTDETIVPLLMALIDNTELTDVNLSGNKGITDVSGRLLLKVLNGGNDTVVCVNLSETGVGKMIGMEVDEIVGRRIAVDFV